VIRVIIKYNVVPQPGTLYEMPTRKHHTVTLALSDGNVTHLAVIFVTAAEKNWGGVNGVRLEGVTTLEGITYKVIAAYKIRSTEQVLGAAELTQLP
jgi:hypothetical protein